MTRAINKKLNKFIEREIYRELLKEFKNINSYNNLNDFFKKFMTDDEKDLIFRRIAVMKLIKQGKKYREIKGLLDISGNTISNVIDILEGRGYSRNPNRKRKYSISKDYRKKKSKSFFPKYKGAESIF